MLIHDHIGAGKVLANHLGKKMFDVPYPVSLFDEWKIEEYLDRIEFDTPMDNFDMWWFLKEIGVKNEHIPPREN
jgi:hypothetical protein